MSCPAGSVYATEQYGVSNSFSIRHWTPYRVQHATRPCPWPVMSRKQERGHCNCQLVGLALQTHLPYKYLGTPCPEARGTSKQDRTPACGCVLMTLATNTSHTSVSLITGLQFYDLQISITVGSTAVITVIEMTRRPFHLKFVITTIKLGARGGAFG
jgi:hypothetical protein